MNMIFLTFFLVQNDFEYFEDHLADFKAKTIRSLKKEALSNVFKSDTAMGFNNIYSYIDTRGHILSYLNDLKHHGVIDLKSSTVFELKYMRPKSQRGDFL